MSELPDGPCRSLNVDFGGPFPSAEYCLIIVDQYSRYPVVEIISSTSNRVLIPTLDKVFSIFGFPVTIKSDNGKTFQSHEFKKFMEYHGIEHRRITPFWPRANAQAEGFMKPLNKAIKTGLFVT